MKTVLYLIFFFILVLTVLFFTFIDKTNNRLDKVEKRVKYLETIINELNKTNIQLTEKDGGFKEITLEEILNFLTNDDTDKFNYSENFTCVDFSNMLISKLRRKGVFSCIVYLEFDKGAHAIVSVNTTDKGVIYIEPQTDQIIYQLKLGEDYCKITNMGCNWIIKYIKSCFDY